MEDEDLESSVPIPNLICREDQTPPCLEDGNEMSRASNGSFLPETEESYIDILVSKESILSSENSPVLLRDSWLRSARADAIQWIMGTKDYFGFGYQTAFLSINCFDRFLTRRSIDKDKVWVVRLLSIACLSLAAKMEECSVPALQQYVDTSDCSFGSDAMQRMELLVLSTLDWRMSVVTPFTYLNHFASKLCVRDVSDTLVSESIRYIFAVTGDINLVDYPASTIAAAAILAAYDQRLTNRLLDSKLRILSSFGAIENEHVLSCYGLMTQKSHEESVPSDGCACSDSSSSTTLSCSHNKRRRLQCLQ